MYARIVADEQSAKEFLAWCVGNLGLGFHPDTSFADYIDPETSRPAFSPDEAASLDEQLERAFAFCDPYEVGLSLFEPRLAART